MVFICLEYKEPYIKYEKGFLHFCRALPAGETREGGGVHAMINPTN